MMGDRWSERPSERRLLPPQRWGGIGGVFRDPPEAM
jgi:hypothetical protein